mgnify:FL=1
MSKRRICILGGSGFVGRHLASALGKENVSIRVLTRNRERNRDLLVIPSLELVEADIHDPTVLRKHFGESAVVINLVGILNDPHRDGRTFRRVHVELPRQIVDICRQTGIRRLLHMSALGAASDAPSKYQQTKAEGEALVLDANSSQLATTTFRPSVIFGRGDSFFNRFARLLRLAPGFFPLPTPHARFSPVYVGDVARAFINSLDERDAYGRSYELCGPRTYTLRELVEYTTEVTGHKRRIIGLGDGLSRLQARILERLPGQPYSYDNYLSSTRDNVGTTEDLERLGIRPTAVEAIVPGYLGNFGARSRYNEFRKEARRV